MQRATPIPVEVVRGTPDCFDPEVQCLGRQLTGSLESSYVAKQGAVCLQGKVQQGDRVLLFMKSWGKSGRLFHTAASCHLSCLRRSALSLGAALSVHGFLQRPTPSSKSGPRK